MPDEGLKTAITVDITKSESWYVASCREIAAVTEGFTFERIPANLHEAVELYLEDEDPTEFGLVPNPSLVLVYECHLPNTG